MKRAVVEDICAAPAALAGKAVFRTALLTGKAAILAAACLGAGLCVEAATVTQVKDNMKDFRSGEFVGFGQGNAYASSWAQLSGHGYWDGDDQLCAGNDYVVPDKRSLRLPNTKNAIGPFPGDSLTIQSGGQLVVYSHGAAVLDWGMNPGLTIQSTKDILNYIGGGSNGKRSDWQTYFDGKVTFDVSGQVKLNPANNVNVGFTFRGPVVSRADTTLRIMGAYTYTSKRSEFFLAEFLGDTTGFLGSFTVSSNVVLSVGATGFANPGNSVRLETCVYPGQEDHAASIRAAAWSNSCDITSLSFGRNAGIEVPVDPTTGTNGLLRVTGALSVTGPVYVYFSDRVTNTSDFVASRHPVLRLGASATGTLNRDDFVFGGYLDNGPPVADDVTFVVEEDETTHEKTLYAEGIKPVVTVLVTALSGNTSSANYFCQSTNEAAWSDGRLPHGGAHYYSDVNWLRFPYEPNVDYEFPGDTLTIAAGRWLTFINRTFTVADLYLKENSTVFLWGNGSGTFRGRIHVPNAAGSSCQLQFLHMRQIMFDSEIDGAGMLRITGNTSSAVPYGSAELTAPNTNFTGKIEVCLTAGVHPTEGVYPTLDKKFMTLYATNQYNLGGVLDSFTFDALQLRNMSRLRTKGSFTIGAQLNRGIWIDWIGRLYVDTGHTLGIETDITYHGLLRKEGPGLLALGGTPRFGTTDDPSAAPEASSNLFEVVEGTFKPLTATCLDGVATTFDAGTALVYDIAPADATLAEKGIMLAKAGSSIAFADTVVPVSFNAPNMPFGGESHQVALFTGTQEQCVALNPCRGIYGQSQDYGRRPLHACRFD